MKRADASCPILLKAVDLVENSEPNLNFEKCIICQDERDEKLTIPTGQGYASLCRDLAGFVECKRDELPFHVARAFKSADDFEGLLNKYKAVYHKHCRNNFNDQKLNRLKNKCKKMLTESYSRVDSNTPEINEFSKLCIFCKTDDSKLSSLTASSPDVLSEITDQKCYSGNCRAKLSAPIIEEDQENFHHSYDIVLKEVIAQIEDGRESSEHDFYKLSQLVKGMTERFNEMGFENCSVHSTRLKDQLLASIPGLRCDKVGREIFLSFDKNVKHILANAIENSNADDDVILKKAADIIKRTFHSENSTAFSGSFNNNFCAEKTVSKTLVTFLSLLIDNGKTFKIAENIAQIIEFNCVKRRKSEVLHVRHNIEREQPLPLYLGLMVHTLTGKKNLVDELFDMGLSISYSRVLDIERALASKVCEIYKQADCICPPNLSKGLFTTAAIDNIDHNPKSTSANYSFHGTGISLIQHYNQQINDDSNQSVCLEKADFSNKGKPSLPRSYYNVPSVPSIDGELPVSTVNWDIPTENIPTKTPLEYTKSWLQNSTKLMNENSYEDLISWAAYNSRLSEDISSYKSTSAMLPLLKDNINSPSVIQHTMNIIIAATNQLNGSQHPVITADQPVYAIAKQLQWLYPEKYGEDKLVIMFGGLHIEKSFLAVLGSWLEGSGWDNALVKAGITTPGRSEGIIKSSHIKKARYAHEVSLTALNIMLFETFKCETNLEDSQYFEWIEKKRKASPQFQYWITAMELEAILLQFIKCLRNADIDQYVEILDKMCPWYLVTDHTHYARWLPIFVSDMKRLPEKHPEIYCEFKRGHFTSRKTNKRFSCISDDQLHEQNNKTVKGSSSLLGMLNDESSIAKWMTSGPELARLISEYRNLTTKYESDDLGHHEDTESFQAQFAKHVEDLVTIFRNKGPFSTTDLTTIGEERKSMNATSVNNVMTASELGLKKYQEYLLDRLITTKLSIHQRINHCQLSLFKIKPERATIERKRGVAAVDSSLFFKMFIANQSRNGDATEFFKHENNRHPPSLSESGKLRKSTIKDEILKCLLPTNSEHVTNGEGISASAIIIHASSVVQNLPPPKVITVKKYSEDIFEKFILKKCETYNWVDIVLDVSKENSLQELIREKSDQEKYVSLIDNETKMFSTKNWFQNFLKNSNTKSQFLKLLASNFTPNVAAKEGRNVHYSEDYVVVSNEEITDFSSICQLSQENAIARLLQHVQHAVRNGHQHILVSTTNSTVIVVALYAFKYLLPDIQKLWVELKNGKCVISIHGLYEVHKDKSDLLLFFQAFTGDDQSTSSFYGIGKKIAWNTWNNFRNVDSAILQLIKNGTPHLCDQSMKVLEKFVISMYDSSSSLTSLHDCRRVLLMKHGIIEGIPPTRNALEQHVKRTLLQVHIWMQCLQNSNINFEASDWGWVKDKTDKYTPLWTTIPILTDHCQELISCGCAEKCNRCNCVKNRLKCTLLCGCGGKCDYTTQM